MKRSDLTEFAVEEEGFKLKICRSNSGVPFIAGGSTALHGYGAESAPAPTAAPAPATPVAGTPAADEAGITYVKSPMVGTFYRSPSPESKSFAEVGTKIVENSVVCIVEAMKIMNEIQAETKGTIIECLVENGQPVEYGQKLFKVKQS